MKFGAVNILATEDKRMIRGVDRLEYVLAKAQALYDWVKNGRATNGSSGTFECDICGSPVTQETGYQWQSSENVLLGCERCFNVHGLGED